MAKLNIPKTRDLLQSFDFKTVFIEELGWSQPASRRPVTFEAADEIFLRAQIAELSGVVVFEVIASDGRIPDAKTRAAIHKQTAKLHHENLLIFVDGQRTQSLWYWVKREEGKSYPREHWYFNGQPGDLFLSKLSSMVVDISEFDESGRLPIVEVASRLKKALDIEHVTKKFYAEFQQEHIAFLEYIKGIDDERDRRWYASVMLNRLMFVYFLQKKYFINNGDDQYLQNKLAESRKRGRDLYYSEFLTTLFFEGFAKPEKKPEVRALIGEVKYLNGGLFLEHRIELDWKRINIADKAFDNLFALFGRYSWNLNDTPGGEDNELNPDVLGYIFEKYINQKAFGAYYTRPEITEYLCERTIHKLILDRVNKPAIPGALPARQFESIAEMLMNLDAQLCRELINDVLPDLRLLDPACGSGAFLVSAMKTLIGVYSAVIGRIKFLSNSNLTRWLKEIEREHDPAYFIKKKIITDNLFGVDIMEEAVEIAKLRLFLALVASAQTVDQLEPLPNIDFNILAGNSLIGLMQVDAKEFDNRYGQGHLFTGSYYRQALEEKNRLIDTYRHTAAYADDLRRLRDNIETKKREAGEALNDILLEDFGKLGIKFEEATWDDAKKKEGKPKKRALNIQDIKALRPFHWGYEFDQIINERGGFDAIITNPPWEVFQTDEKEFFGEYVPTIKKKNLRIEDWKKQQATLMEDPTLRTAWLDYSSRFPHLSKFFKNAPQYRNQISIIDGRNVGSKIDLYSYFVEQSFNLLRPGGRCGILTPGGVYLDLGVKQLREMLLSQTQLDSLFGLSNEKFIFEGVHHAKKFCVLVFQKGSPTDSFEAAFRINPRDSVEPDDLDVFLHSASEHIRIPVQLVRQLSPNSLSMMEFKDQREVQIADKLSQFSLVGTWVEGSWNLRLSQEFNMTTDSALFRNSRGSTRLPLYEGKMIHQFDHKWGDARYWLDEREAAGVLLSSRERAVRNAARKANIDWEDADDLLLDYRSYRLAFRDVSASTNERTMIMTVLPPKVFCPHTMSLESVYGVQVYDGLIDPNKQSMTTKARLYLCAIMNSFGVDWWLRLSVTSHLSFFFVYGVPVPRLTESNPVFVSVGERTAKLICTTPEFDDLANEVGLGSHKNGVTDPTERAKLRAELDGMIAHLYGLTEEEFTHILSTFPLVEQSVKDAALEAYRELAPKPGDQEIAALIAKGESNQLEFKSSARWDFKQGKQNKVMEDIVVKTIAAFLNTDGGNLLIGVGDDRNVLGLDHDYKLFAKKDSRDAYENFLTTLLLNNLGKDTSALISISIHQLDGKDVARVTAKPSPKPVFVKEEKYEHLYIRAGNSTRLLSTREAIDYCKIRWQT
jgi:type I restriction-modification system DNA methylase subunit